MHTDFVNLKAENLSGEHLCSVIRAKKQHPGVEAKQRWLSERLNEGHVFRKLNAKGCAFIEYASLETAWVPITGENYNYIYCLWVTGSLKGHGCGQALHGVLPGRRKGNGEIRRLHAGGKKAKSLAL